LRRLQRRRLAAEVNGKDRGLLRQAATAGSGSGSGTCGGCGDRRLQWWRQAMEEKERAAAAEPSGRKDFCAGGMGKPLNMDCAKFCAAQPVNPLF